MSVLLSNAILRFSVINCFLAKPLAQKMNASRALLSSSYGCVCTRVLLITILMKKVTDFSLLFWNEVFFFGGGDDVDSNY